MVSNINKNYWEIIMNLKGNRFGQAVFWASVASLQVIDEIDSPTYTKSIVAPMGRLKMRTMKLVDSWILVAGMSVGLLTVKIVIENLVSHR
jgi:hypothetical protein